MLAHWCGGYVDPWSIEPTKFQNAMQLIWNEVYRDKIKHEITLNGAVYHVVSQLNVLIVTPLPTILFFGL